MSSPSLSDIRRTLDRLERFSYYTDSNIRLPFTNFRFGLSPLIGLIPGAGDFAGLILSLYVLYEARKIGASRRVQRRIIHNMLIEFIVGLVPAFGDAFDALYKANTKNTKILQNYLYRELDEEPKSKFPWFTFFYLVLLILLIVALIIVLF
ncbi:MAG: DUF4112 domain-containing protein [Balneolaceae bacterium]